MKILLPTDGSRYALAAARAITGWFSWPGGKVDVLAVAPESRKSDHRNYGKDPEWAAEWRGTVGEWLDATARHLDGSGLRVNRLERQGDPAQVVLDAAGEGYDLVAVGVKGRSEQPWFASDSVALAVLEHAPTSVLLVRDRTVSGRKDRLPTSQQPLRVVLAVDGRGPSEAAVQMYGRLAASDATEVTVVAVAGEGEGRGLSVPEASSIVRRTSALLGEKGVRAVPDVHTGAPVLQILDAAEEADLLVMGSRSGEDPDVCRLGSVGLAVARSTPCSILFVRSAEPGAALEVEKEIEAITPVQIAYEGMKHSTLAERYVHRGLARLERIAPDLVQAHVTLGQSNRRHQSGNLYDVRLNLSLPGDDVVVSRTPADHIASEDLVTAIGEAFETARRMLVEKHRIERGDVKHHEAPQKGRVADLLPDYGFIRATDGRIVYFHRNSVLGGAWDELTEGAQVTFVDEPGDMGPQATTVTFTAPRSIR